MKGMKVEEHRVEVETFTVANLPPLLTIVELVSLLSIVLLILMTNALFTVNGEYKSVDGQYMTQWRVVE
jgi:hypothetical protein